MRDAPPDRLASVKVDPTRLSEEFARPDIVALVGRGYRVAQALPFEERGDTVLVLIFEPPAQDAGGAVDRLRDDLGRYAVMLTIAGTGSVGLLVVLLAVLIWRIA